MPSIEYKTTDGNYTFKIIVYNGYYNVFTDTGNIFAHADRNDGFIYKINIDGLSKTAILVNAYVYIINYRNTYDNL